MLYDKDNLENNYLQIIPDNNNSWNPDGSVPGTFSANPGVSWNHIISVRHLESWMQIAGNVDLKCADILGFRRVAPRTEILI